MSLLYFSQRWKAFWADDDDLVRIVGGRLRTGRIYTVPDGGGAIFGAMMAAVGMRMTVTTVATLAEIPSRQRYVRFMACRDGADVATARKIAANDPLSVAVEYDALLNEPASQFCGALLLLGYEPLPLGLDLALAAAAKKRRETS